MFFRLRDYLKRGKNQFLLATTQSLKYGKFSNQFLMDSDFSYYLNNEDFLLILNLGVGDEQDFNNNSFTANIYSFI